MSKSSLYYQKLRDKVRFYEERDLKLFGLSSLVPNGFTSKLPNKRGRPRLLPNDDVYVRYRKNKRSVIYGNIEKVIDPPPNFFILYIT